MVEKQGLECSCTPGLCMCLWFTSPRCREAFCPYLSRCLGKEKHICNEQACSRQCAANNHRVVTSVAAQGRLQPRCQDWPLTLFDTGRSCSSISLIPELAGLPKPCAGHSRTRTSSSLHFSRRSCGVFLMPAAPSLASLAVFLLWKGEIQGGNSTVEVPHKGLSSRKLCSVIAVGQV